jgi:hypothetical protein
MDDRTDLAFTAKDDTGGLVIASFVGRDEAGRPMVCVPDGLGGRIVTATAAATLDGITFGAEVVVMFDAGDPDKAVVIGRVARPAPAPASEAMAVTLDGETLRLSAEKGIVLSCGKSSVTLTRSGKIILRGTSILSRATGTNKMKGGSIQLN